ncbi:hypothetical protein QR680_013337 [Steinernema hermaphroditum]|uniref:Uncharacterized protein n=1 Tax=Steinernema hermaphroditum TaxID=289476 RepID=A0AA39I6Q2_9BILA|nr:hypothetical protein QR680_013337 [Steinernema hermaphroditum]
MKLTSAVLGNLNKVHWNRRVWEIGYRGPHLPQRKATGRPHYPVTSNRVAELRERFEREYNVMRCLATPYFTKDQEAAYWDKYTSVDAQNETKKLETQQRRMPGEIMPSSYTSPIDASPGWNDPPPFVLNGFAPSTASFPKKHVRPIDPSVQAVCSHLMDNGATVHVPQNPPVYGNASLHQYGYAKGQQIISILSKAAEKLQTNGNYNMIRQELQCLRNYIDAARLPENCVSQLHAVAIAMHQGSYDDAMLFYQEMTALFPLEVLNWGWGHGLKLMIAELLTMTFI